MYGLHIHKNTKFPPAVLLITVFPETISPVFQKPKHDGSNERRNIHIIISRHIIITPDKTKTIRPNSLQNTTGDLAGIQLAEMSGAGRSLILGLRSVPVNYHS